MFGKIFKKFIVIVAAALVFNIIYIPQQSEGRAASYSKRQMEGLDRGLVAVASQGGVFLSWRMFATDPADISFNIYRNGIKVNNSPIHTSTNYFDNGGTVNDTYYIRPVLDNIEQTPSSTVTPWKNNYLDIPLMRPSGDVTPDGVNYTYNANDCSVGDLDGDGQYEVVLKWDPSNSKDNSHDGYTGNVYIDAYKLDGTFLWRIDLGKNIRAGAHYTQFIVYDLDGDGKAEIACKTADGTIDGKGKAIGDAGADYRNSAGRILEGPECLSIFEGATGRELVTVPYEPARGDVSSWGDNYGNRVDRFLACVAYLDGQRPSLVMCRGYYTRTVLVAYNWRNGSLSKVWTFDSNTDGNQGYAGQGNHNLSVADVDGDGRDEIIYGACAIDDDGTGLYTTGLGHGDAMHVTDIDPNRPGLEVWQCHESVSTGAGASLRDAATGEVLFRATTSKDCGRALAADVDPAYKGCEMWAAAGVGLYDCKGRKISDTTPSINFAIWWDGDLQRELLDDISVSKYNNGRISNVLTADGCASNNGTKANPCLQADILGDWREEVIWRTADNNALRIYTTTSLTEHRIYTLMHDPVYRLGIVWQNVAYNQPPHTGFYLGGDMQSLPVPDIYTLNNVLYADVNIHPGVLNLKSKGTPITIEMDLNGYDKLTCPSIDELTLEINGKALKGCDNIEYKNNKFKFKINRIDMIEAMANKDGALAVSVKARLSDGKFICGNDVIKTIN